MDGNGNIMKLQEMEQYFQSAVQQNVAFMLCFHPDTDDEAHHIIKACQRRYMVGFFDQ